MAHKFHSNWLLVHSNIKKIVNDEIKWIKKINKAGLKRKFKNYLK